MAKPRINLDANQRNADWIKTLYWDLPTDPDIFLQVIGGKDALPHFLTLPAAEKMPPELAQALGVLKIADTSPHRPLKTGLTAVRIKGDADQPRDDQGQWTDGGGGGASDGGVAATGKDSVGEGGVESPRFGNDAPSPAAPSEREMFASYLKETGGFVYHGTSDANMAVILKDGLRSPEDVGEPLPTDEEFEEFDDPYMHDGVYTGDLSRAQDFGTVLQIDVRGLEGKLLEAIDDGDTKDFPMYGSISPDRISVYTGAPA